jgi:hypothetical protein
LAKEGRRNTRELRLASQYLTNSLVRFLQLFCSFRSRFGLRSGGFAAFHTAIPVQQNFIALDVFVDRPFDRDPVIKNNENTPPTKSMDFL